MDKLVETDTAEIFGLLETLKYYFDEGGVSVPKIFAEYDTKYERSYEEEQEQMEKAAEFVMKKQFYQKNENDEIDEDSEIAYERWFFSGANMTEYYKYLYQLYRAKIISGEELTRYKRARFEYARSMIGGMRVGGHLQSKINHRYASYIVVYIDYEYSYYEPVRLACSIATIFDAYTAELKRLKEKYGYEEKNGDSFQTKRAA